MKAITIALLAAGVAAAPGHPARADGQEVKKIKDVIIYNNEMFYSAFPSVIVRPGGEVLCAFRRAPDRKRLWGAPGFSHTDTNSYLVLVRSRDGGSTWTKEPELIFAHPLGGSQDPCMVQLRDGTIICTSYGWAMLPGKSSEEQKQTLNHPPFSFLGGYIMRSFNGGKSWEGPIIPPHIEGDTSIDATGNPCPTFNRGAMLELDDGTLLWAVVKHTRMQNLLSSVHLISSTDKGRTWHYVCPVAEDGKASFNETSLVQTESGDIIAFMRTADFDGKLAFARSTDGGESFQKWEDGSFYGHPFHALLLPDGRVFLVYGYRVHPFGIRAKVLKSDCSDIATAPEIFLRQDGGNGDLGYPWAALLPDGRVLVAYYFNTGDSTRHIAGSILEID